MPSPMKENYYILISLIAKFATSSSILFLSILLAIIKAKSHTWEITLGLPEEKEAIALKAWGVNISEEDPALLSFVLI